MIGTAHLLHTSQQRARAIGIEWFDFWPDDLLVSSALLDAGDVFYWRSIGFHRMAAERKDQCLRKVWAIRLRRLMSVEGS